MDAVFETRYCDCFGVLIEVRKSVRVIKCGTKKHKNTDSLNEEKRIVEQGG